MVCLRYELPTVSPIKTELPDGEFNYSGQLHFKSPSFSLGKCESSYYSFMNRFHKWLVTCFKNCLLIKTGWILNCEVFKGNHPPGSPLCPLLPRFPGGPGIQKKKKMSLNLFACSIRKTS